MDVAFDSRFRLGEAGEELPMIRNLEDYCATSNLWADEDPDVASARHARIAAHRERVHDIGASTGILGFPEPVVSAPR